FFSSRRRHTRCYRDWSSDVCSSDLRLVLRTADQLGAPMPVAGVAYDHFLSAASRGRGGLDWTAVSEVVHEAAGLAPAWGSSTSRSEERRVGKEWRSRGTRRER